MNNETLIQLQTTGRADRGVETTSAVDGLLADYANAAVAIGVSGGKDSCAAAIATNEHLNLIGHAGPRLLIHSDLGRVEWKDSLPTCERLAARLGIELAVVRRAAGDMMDRWLVRWANNVERYAKLSCVKIILPWSTPSMRFCTSELKTAIICRELIKRFPGKTILSATGVRRDESHGRKNKPTISTQAKLVSSKHQTYGYDWRPIGHWTSRDVYTFLAQRGFKLHEAYERYGLTRVSCAYCIMSSEADLIASTRCDENVPLYREMVDLEIESTFAFQGDRWLADVAPQLLTVEQREEIAEAKEAANERRKAEALIPEHLLYEEGWPRVMPTPAEAKLLAGVRRKVAAVVGIPVECVTAADVLDRYAELMAMREASRGQ